MNIVILGSGFASLKLASLISEKACEYRDSVILITCTKRFIFLPLIPNYLDDSLKGKVSNITTDINAFCQARNISFITEKILDHDITDGLIYAGSRSISYDILFDGRGYSNGTSNEKDTYKEWEQLVNLLDSSEHGDIIFLDKPGIAEFELVCALKSAPKKITIKIKSNSRMFSTHPVLKNILNSNVKRRYRYTASKKVKIDKSKLIQNKRILIGGALARQLNCPSSAQFASYTAKLAYNIYAMNRQNRFKLIQQTKVPEYFSERGKMIYLGLNKAGIWIGDDASMSIKPLIDGKLASSIRLQFYLLQMRMFYAVSVPKKLLSIYRFYLNTV